ncbi:MAG: MFS transporter [Actinobacteria bacterium]|nr:MFS transporter [Actinomycetota bacterium]
MKKERKNPGKFFNVYIASIGSFFTDISSEMVYPLVPIFITTILKAPASVVGLIEGIAESTAAILKVFSGYLSDLFKRRKELAISGYAMSTIGKVFLFIAGSWPLVLLGRFIDRLGKGIRTAPRDALIAESVDSNQRGKAFGFHRAFDTLGAALGVLISYLILSSSVKEYEIRKIFLLSLIPAALGVITLLFLKEPERKIEVKAEKISFKSLNKPLKYFLFISLIFSLGNSSDQFLLLRAKGLGASTLTVLLIYFTFNAFYALLSYPAGRLSDIIGRRRIIVPGYIIYSVVYFIVARATKLSEIWTAFILYGVYQAFTQGVERAIVSDFSTSDIRATAIGAHAMITGAGLLPASLIAGMLWDFFGPQAAFYFGSFTSILSAFFLWLLLLKYEGGGKRNVA